MKSKDFIKEAPVDDLIDKNNQQQQPLSAPPAQQKPGVVTKAARAGSNVLGMISKGINQGSSLGGGAGAVGAMPLPGSSGGGYGAAPAGNQPIDYIPGKIDAHVANYLTKAANRQPLKQSTGNQNIDTILKAAGLLR